ncbi:MAG: hypothetical protein K5648_02750 [Erysipelotrichaceae bacterium]|nr:hypothetical protein [Erysipelotrichaceae bacterium]
MKKILTLSLILIFLSGCGAKTLSWQDAQTKYDEAYQQTVETANAYDSYSIDEFKQLTDKVLADASQVTAGVKEEDEEGLLSLYKDAVFLQQLASSSNSVQSNTLNLLCEDVITLIEAAYEKGKLDDLKTSIASRQEEIESWSDEDWRLVEKKRTLHWKDVESHYETLESETIDALPRASQLSETDLEGYKNTILNNYPLIQDGVLEENMANADAVYEAGVALRYYMEDLEGEDAKKVYDLGNQAIEYVKICFGETVDDPDYDFLKIAQSAEKWTLSLWNELIKLLNL